MMNTSYIIPALDLYNGEIVRLHKGNYDELTNYDHDPIQQFTSYINEGAERLHLVDLNGAENPDTRQIELIKKIVESTQSDIQVGGGIRSEKDLKNLFDIGVHRAVVGSVAVENFQMVKSWFNQFGSDKFVLALDINIDNNGSKFVAIHGWKKTSMFILESLIEEYSSIGVNHILCTDISKDGTLSGPNISLYKNLCDQFPQINIQSSGGIGSISDIEKLKTTSVNGVIVGKALLEKKFTVKEAIACWQKELFPA